MLRGAVAGAALLSGGMGMTHEAKAAEPTEQRDNIEDARAARNQELTGWVSDFDIQGLEVKRDGSRCLTEGIDVSVNGVRIGSANCSEKKSQGFQYTKETLHAAVQEILARNGYIDGHTPSVSENRAEQVRMPLADRVSFEDPVKTMELMKTWGIEYTGTSLILHQGNPDPIVAIGEPNAEIVFRHVGENTIIVHYVERDGDQGDLRIVNGVER